MYPEDVLSGAILALAFFLIIISSVSYRRSGVRAALGVLLLSILLAVKNAFYILGVLYPGLLPVSLPPESLVLDVALLLILLSVIIIRRGNAGR